ncbi:hypothetical protein AURDEDRAFT_168827 [Auricularia subglabra TFB-10046 SS5]|nr:hypothetical protein AURDEDRAFT_168827 [Auricularia subglabra TFB-10046 SS5]
MRYADAQRMPAELSAGLGGGSIQPGATGSTRGPQRTRPPVCPDTRVSGRNPIPTPRLSLVAARKHVSPARPDPYTTAAPRSRLRCHDPSCVGLRSRPR